MPLTKIIGARKLLTGLSLALAVSGSLPLAPSLSPAIPISLISSTVSSLAPAALAQSKSSSRKGAKSNAAKTQADDNGDSEITPALAALWRQPSPAFTATFAHVGEEPRETSIENLRKFLASGINTPFGAVGADGSPTEKQAASYALARLLTKGKNNQASLDERKEALSLFEKATAMPCLHMASVWHMVEIFNALGDETTTRNFLAKINDDAFASDNDKARAQYEMAQSFLRVPAAPSQSAGTSNFGTAGGTGSDQAKNLLLSLREKYPGTEYAKGACYYLAQISLAAASPSVPPEAVAYLKEYIKFSTNGRFSNDVADKLISLSQAAPGSMTGSMTGSTTGPATGSATGATTGFGTGSTTGSATGSGAPPVTLTTDELEQIAAVYYKRGDLTKALAVYDRLGPNAKLLQRAQCYATLKRKSEAVAAILAAVKQDPNSSNYDDYAASVCVPLTRDEATDLWRKILALNPKHADHALYNIATRVEESEAMPLLTRLLSQFPTSEHAPESLWWVFWYQTKVIFPGSITKDKEKALSLIKLADQGPVRYPQHRVAARLAFWAGKIYEKLGQSEAAKKEYELAADKYPTNYYGSRARARLHVLATVADSKNQKHDRGFAVSNNRLLSPDTWNWPQPPQLFSFDKVAPLVGAQATVLAITHQCDESLAKIESTAAARAESGPDRQAVDCLRSWLYLSQAMPMEGIRAAGHDLNGTPTKTPRWQIQYPWAYAAAINEAARKNGVDPYLVHALIREESRYFPMALSRSKAIGLMQLLEGTAFGVAKRIGLSISSKDEIFIPENNIKMGTAYLAYTLSRFDGQAMLAVASYNGGPNAVKRWVDAFHAKGQNDWDIFVENIPFRETRDYVRKVFGSYWTYEQIYQ